LFRESDDM